MASESASDITLMLTSDGREWGQYISERLKRFPKVTHSTIILDEQEYENPPEVTAACRQSTVLLLLATPQLLEFLSVKAGWFSSALLEQPATSSLVVVMLLDQAEIDDVTKDRYVTSEWRYCDAGHSVQEVQQTIAEVLDTVEKCHAVKDSAAAAGKEGGKEEEAVGAVKKGPPPPTAAKPRSTTAKGKVHVDFYPSTVYEYGVPVAMVFKDDLNGDVSVKFEQTDIQLTAHRENDRVFTFAAPQVAAGKHNVLIYLNNKRHARAKLTVHGVHMAAFTSPNYLTQALGLASLEDLDLHLKDAFNTSLSADQNLEALFRVLPSVDLSEQQKNSDSLYPTLLHYAAAHGLIEFCAALMECPCSCRAYRIRNCEGQDPAELAALNGFEELENYIIDFMEMQEAKDIYDHYIAMQPPPGPEEDYEDMRYLSPPQLRNRSASESAVPHFSASSPDTPRAPSPPGAGRPDRPPVLPPRSAGPSRCQSERHGSTPPSLHTVSEAEHQTTGTKSLSAADFMGMGSTDTYKQSLPQAAMGSRSQSELIELNQMVKSNEINVNEATMLFNAWQQRYGRNNGTSFKDRQKELSHIKSEYMQIRDVQQKRDTPSKSFFSRLGLGGRQTKSTIKVNISEPVMQRQQKKGPKVFTKSASASQLLPSADRDSCASTSSSSCSSRDSGWSQGSRGSTVSTMSMNTNEVDSEGEEVFTHERSISRRKSSNTTSTNRLSLGHQYLQQVEEEKTERKSDKPPPPLPPRKNCPPLPSRGSRRGSASSTRSDSPTTKR